MTEKLLRTFISVTVPKQTLALQEMLTTTVKLQKGNIRWVKRGQVHLTLKFLGHTPPDTIDELNSIIDKIVSQYRGMKLRIKGTGCFPVPTRPRVLWLGIDGDTESLKSLVSDLDRAIEPLGFPREKANFVPHITIARVKYPPKWTPDVRAFLNTTYEPIPMKVNRMQFMSSELFPNGPVYSILGTHFLAPNSKLGTSLDNS